MRNDARDDITKLLNTMLPLLKIAKIPESQLNVCKGPRYTINHYVKAFDWLHEFSMSSELNTFKKAYALRTPETWAVYEAMGTEGLYEQRKLEGAALDLQKRWKFKKPRMFSHDKETIDDQQDENQENFS